MDTLKKILIGGAVVILLVLLVFGVRYLLLRTTPNTTQGGTTVKNSQTFGTGSTQTTDVPLSTETIDTTGINTQQKIFKIADGPVMAATFIQVYNPTTTIARYIKQDNGHVFDIPVNVPGAIARVVSNTTIPGLRVGEWFVGGSGVIIQYENQKTVKTVYLNFSSTGALTATTSVKLTFLPDNISGLASSPDGKHVAYLLPTSGGVAGYIANANGTGAVKLFTLPFTQVLLSWPTGNTLLVQTKEATGVPGIAFSVSTKGTVTPLVFAESLSASANTTFSKIVYESTQNSGSTRTTYVHDVKSGKDSQLPFNPFPEKCIWSSTQSTIMYCAAPLDATPVNYLDLWHQGLVQSADNVFAFDVSSNITSLVAQPGSAQGGVAGDIDQLAISPDRQYLLYITRGDRTLWGVKIGH